MGVTGSPAMHQLLQVRRKFELENGDLGLFQLPACRRGAAGRRMEACEHECNLRLWWLRCCLCAWPEWRRTRITTRAAYPKLRQRTRGPRRALTSITPMSMSYSIFPA